jgi:tRNA uridine 5-carbamoylmethylation protein Kti12
MYLLLLSGLPTSGKSSFVNIITQSEEWKHSTVLSTDNFIERIAQENNSTHDKVFRDSIKPATKQLNFDLDDAVKNFRPIIWDQTNLTIKTRNKKLNKAPMNYTKIIVYFEIALEDALLRNQNRPGKIIPIDTLRSMYESFEIPTTQECPFVFYGNDPSTLFKLTTYLPYLTAS